METPGLIEKKDIVNALKDQASAYSRLAQIAFDNSRAEKAYLNKKRRLESLIKDIEAGTVSTIQIVPDRDWQEWIF